MASFRRTRETGFRQCESSSRSLLIEQPARMPGDHQVFVGGYDPCRHTGAGIRYAGGPSVIGRLVQYDAKPPRGPAGARPDLERMLADARGKYQRVEPAERRSKRSELASDAVDEEVDGLFCRWRIARQQGPHIAGNARDAEEPRTLPDQLLDRLGVHPLVLQKVEDHARVERAGASPHRQAIDRCETHCGGDAAPLIDGALLAPLPRWATTSFFSAQSGMNSGSADTMYS